MGLMRVYARDFQCILESTAGKKVILYGATRRDSDLIKKLNCLGINVAYCVEDDGALTDEQLSKVTQSDMEVKNVYELLLEEEPYYVIIIKNSIRKCSNVLDKLGLEVIRDYNRLFLGSDRSNLERGYSLDPTMGHGQAGYGDRGVGIIGDLDNAKYRIAIIGGSTSDEFAFPWKSWGRLLYEMLNEQGYKVSILIGAVVGYSSSEELIKLVRDILPLKPHMIISYSGANDHDTNRPYLNLYQMELFNSIRGKKVNDWNDLGSADCVTWGVTRKISGTDNWIKNQRIMHNIAIGEGCAYCGVYQPQLLTKKRGNKDEETWIYVELSLKKEYEQCLPYARSEIAKIDYIIDGSAWFDEIDGLYYDRHHVFEEGNKMIADKVFRIVKSFMEGENGVSF